MASLWPLACGAKVLSSTGVGGEGCQGGGGGSKGLSSPVFEDSEQVLPLSLNLNNISILILQL